MRRTLNILFLGLIISSALSGVKAQTNEPIVIKVPDHKKFRSDFDSFIIDRSFLALETNPEGLMPGHPANIHFYKDIIIIQYPWKEGLYFFSKNGKFIAFTNPIGAGPLECKSIARISIFNDEVFALDIQGGKVLVFDLKGNPIREIPTPMYPHDIIHNDEGQLLLYMKKEDFNGKPFDILSYDESSGKFSGYMPVAYYNQAMFNAWEMLSQTSAGPMMGVTASDTIFSLSGSKAEPAYILDYGKLGLKQDQIRTFSMIKLQHTKKRFMTLWKNWKQVDSIISFMYYTNDRIDNILFHDMNTNKFYGDSWDYPDFELGRIYAPMGTTDDSYVFIIQAVKIIEEAEQHPERCSKELLEVAKTLDEEDNPVLMFWRVK